MCYGPDETKVERSGYKWKKKIISEPDGRSQNKIRMKTQWNDLKMAGELLMRC